jgi:hypothetical protein
VRGIAARALNASSSTAQNERIALIDEFVCSLGERDRQILLAKLEGTYEPLARSLETTSGALRTHACRLWSRFKRFAEDSAPSTKRAQVA